MVVAQPDLAGITGGCLELFAGLSPSNLSLEEVPDELSELDKLLRHLKVENIREFGRGGLGVVYEVRPFNSNSLRPERLALKILNTGVYSLTDSLLFEAQCQTEVHKYGGSVPKVHDFGSYEGLQYLLMEVVEKIPESSREKELINYACDLAQTLAVCYGRKIEHRDVKKSNVGVCNTLGRFQGVLFDFGSAVREKEGHLLQARGLDNPLIQFSLPSAAPELFPGYEYSYEFGKADQFSLGTTIYHLITGSAPFSNKNDSQRSWNRDCVGEYLRLAKGLESKGFIRVNEIATYLTNVHARRILRPNLVDTVIKYNHPLFAVVDQLLEPNPTSRFGSMTEVYDALNRCR